MIHEFEGTKIYIIWHLMWILIMMKQEAHITLLSIDFKEIQRNSKKPLPSRVGRHRQLSTIKVYAYIFVFYV